MEKLDGGRICRCKESVSMESVTRTRTGGEIISNRVYLISGNVLAS